MPAIPHGRDKVSQLLAKIFPGHFKFTFSSVSGSLYKGLCTFFYTILSFNYIKEKTLVDIRILDLLFHLTGSVTGTLDTKMEQRLADRAKEDENNCKQALLSRYLEDQVLYNFHNTREDECCKIKVSSFDVFEEGKSRSKRTNDVIVKINDKLASPESQDHILNQRERRRSSRCLSLHQDAKSNNLMPARHAKLSRSLDEMEFKSIFLDIPNQSDLTTASWRTKKRNDLTKSHVNMRKYSDCSSSRTKNYETPRIGRRNATDNDTDDVHSHPTNTLVRGMLKKVSLPVFGINERAFGRKPILSMSSLDGSIQDFNHLKDGEAFRASMSSFRSSCSSFHEVEFDDSDYDRSCTNSPCSSLNATCIFPPINNESNNQ